MFSMPAIRSQFAAVEDLNMEITKDTEERERHTQVRWHRSILDAFALDLDDLWRKRHGDS